VGSADSSREAPPWRVQRRHLCLGQRRGRGCVGEDELGVGAQGRLGGGMPAWEVGIERKSADAGGFQRRG
jgi:hypothetical protein